MPNITVLLTINQDYRYQTHIGLCDDGQWAVLSDLDITKPMLISYDDLLISSTQWESAWMEVQAFLREYVGESEWGKYKVLGMLGGL